MIHYTFNTSKSGSLQIVYHGNLMLQGGVDNLLFETAHKGIEINKAMPKLNIEKCKTCYYECII